MNGNGSYYRSPKNFKPKWVCWEVCKKCGKKFDSRNRKRTICPDCVRKEKEND